LWLKGLFPTISEINPDIIFVHGIETLTAMRIIFSNLTKKYLIVSDTHTLLNQLNRNLRGRIFLAFVKFFYSKVINKKDIIIFYTAQENKLVLKNIYGISSRNIKESLIGTNLSDYKYDSNSKSEKRKELNIPESAKIILYVGKINNKKRPHLILNAVKKIENEIGDDLFLIFIGALDQDYFDRNFNVKFRDNIKLIYLSQKPNKELYKYYSSADFAVFPKENTLSALDAQACKLPLIMENDLTNSERLSGGGLLYEKNDIDDLSKKILLLLNDTKLLKILSENGYQYVKNNYDYVKIVKRMENDLYEEYEKKFQ
jgi:glycosyltransferase involved in cell wall biosynthesis